MEQEKNSSTEATPLREELGRDLSLFHLTMLGLGMMIGAGVFLGVGISIHEAGPGGALLTFAFNGILALFTAMSYAELSSALPRASGAYTYSRIGFGKIAGFFAGWIEWFAACIAGSMYAVTFAIYTLHYLRETGLPDYLPFVDTIGGNAGGLLTTEAVAIFIALLFLFINTRNAAGGGKFASILSLCQLFFLIVIIGAGFITAVRDPSRIMNFSPFLPRGRFQVLVTMGFTFVAFEGFEVIAQAGDEARRPRQNLPKAIFYAVFIVSLLYVLITFITIISVKAGAIQGGMVPWRWIGGFYERGFAAAVTSLFPGAGFFLTLAVIFASVSALNITIFSAARTSFSMAKDRMLPGFLTVVSRKRKVPISIFLLTGTILSAGVLFLKIEQIVALAGFLFLVLFIMVNISAIAIRKKDGKNLFYGYIMPLFPLFPIAAVVFQSVIAVCVIRMSTTTLLIAGAWAAAGAVLYLFYTGKKEGELRKEVYIQGKNLYSEFPQRTDIPLNILVAVANPENALQLVSAVERVCSGSDVKIDITHLVRTPPQIPLGDAEQYYNDENEQILEVMLYLSNMKNMTTTVRYCRNVSRGIVNTVREKGTNLLFLGWEGPRRNTGVRYGRIIDPVLERTPCAVAVVKEYANKVYRNVLVPVSGGPNGGLALEIGSIIASQFGGTITLLAVSQNGPSQKKKRLLPRKEFNLSNFLGKNKHRLHIPVENVSIHSIVSKEKIADIIVKESKSYDMVVMGCGYETILKRNITGIVPERVADSITIPLIMVKAQNPMKSLFRRWF